MIAGFRPVTNGGPRGWWGLSSAGQETGSDAVGDPPESPRVFISYAHDDSAHEERVREFWLLLRANSIDAKLDRPGSEERRDWAPAAGRSAW